MDEAIDVAIEGRSVFPSRAAFINAATPWTGQEAMQAARERLSVVLVGTIDGETGVLALDRSV